MTEPIDLAQLAEDVTKDLPIAVRKVIKTAIENGWTLNPPGMTVALRLNHPTDELAEPVYITWAVGRTPKGALSFRFSGCGTRGLVPLSGADLLVYLADPTVVYMTDEDIAAKEETERQKGIDKLGKVEWNPLATEVENVALSLGGRVIDVHRTTAAELMEDQRTRILESREAPVQPSVTKGLRVSF